MFPLFFIGDKATLFFSDRTVRSLWTKMRDDVIIFQLQLENQVDRGKFAFLEG